MASPRRGWQISLQVPALSLECQVLVVEQVPRSRSVGSRSSGRPGQPDQPGCFPLNYCVIPKCTVWSTLCLYGRIASCLRFDPTAVRSQCPAGRCEVCLLSECRCMRSLGVTWQRSPLVSSPASVSVRVSHILLAGVSHILLADVSLLTVRPVTADGQRWPLFGSSSC